MVTMTGIAAGTAAEEEEILSTTTKTFTRIVVTTTRGVKDRHDKALARLVATLVRLDETLARPRMQAGDVAQAR